MVQKKLSHRTRTLYRGAPTPIGSDKRANFSRDGRQGTTTCAVCHAEVTIKKADSGDVGEGIRRDDLLTSPHRVGGGRVSIRRGDVECRGSRVHVLSDDD